MLLAEILDLSPHGPDTFVGAGPQYPWGGLYGGQIVAQALRAAASTVEPEFAVHSLRAYFIRRGDHDETVRYEVDRIRNGRSFCTRRVVARQAIGAILNLEASFQHAEPSADVSTIAAPADATPPANDAELSNPPGSEIPGFPDALGPDGQPVSSSWTPIFDRVFVPKNGLGPPVRDGGGRAAAWLRVTEPIDDSPVTQAAAFAYLSDDLPTDAVVRAHPMGLEPMEELYRHLFTASLDHAIWFHRPFRVDEWHLHDFSCHSFTGGRGLSLGHVFTTDGRHVATVAQEVLMRDTRAKG